jgi:hypothetical protein
MTNAIKSLDTSRTLRTRDGEAYAGRGKASHSVPADFGRVVLIRDGAHSGTEVSRIDGGYRFVSLDSHSVSAVPRCVLVALGSVLLDDLQIEEPYGCDLDGDGLLLVGVSQDDPCEWEDCAVLWDSATDANG